MIHQQALDALCRAVEDLLHNAEGIEECFNPSQYYVSSDALMALQHAYDAFCEAEEREGKEQAREEGGSN